ncbi:MULTISPECIES: tetratricopeptide repeat protein [Aequorivita]|uniref:Tetratricopeptide repeat protein n=1 Tax=Aequorivita iocasae TaxID=2803865 RepID=A0ABX7DMR2_9FLAO|nr:MULTISPECIES: tetratricopeptide repeat protein [Aequorivita]QQX75254.1 tetratricopeptide repeat protein [Aequorivita iocasae]UCA54702.1 tetratricopeptide repeat protein [Aequorivita sp. F7]
MALNNIGANYYALLNYGEALHYYLDAYQIDIRYLDEEREMIVLNNIAILYMSDKEYNKAAEYGPRALRLATNMGNAKRSALYAVNLGLIYNKLGELEKASHYFEILEGVAITDSHITFINKVGKTENAYLSGEYNKASELARTLLSEAEERKEFDLVNHLYLLLSQIDQHQQRYSEALDFGRKALDSSPDLESKIAAMEQMANIHFIQKNYKDALVMKESILKYRDSLHQIKNGKYFESHKLSFEIKKSQQDVANSMLQLQQERKFHYSLLSALGALFLVVLLGFRNIHLKNRQKKVIAERERAQALLALKEKEGERLILEKQMLEKTTQQQLEHSRLKHEIEIKKPQAIHQGTLCDRAQ